MKKKKTSKKRMKKLEKMYGGECPDVPIRGCVPRRELTPEEIEQVLRVLQGLPAFEPKDYN